MTGSKDGFLEPRDRERGEESSKKYRIVDSAKLIQDMDAGEIGWSAFDSVGVLESRHGRNPLPYREYGARSVLEVHTGCMVQPDLILSSRAVIILRDVDRTFYSPMIPVLKQVHRWPNALETRRYLQPIIHLEMDIFEIVIGISGFTMPPEFIQLLQDAW